MREKQGIYWWISAVGMCVALMGMTLQPDPLAADVDGDGLDDAWESANGYSVLLKTHIVHVDAVNGDDVTGDGVTAATALPRQTRMCVRKPAGRFFMLRSRPIAVPQSVAVRRRSSTER